VPERPNRPESLSVNRCRKPKVSLRGSSGASPFSRHPLVFFHRTCSAQQRPSPPHFMLASARPSSSECLAWFSAKLLKGHAARFSSAAASCSRSIVAWWASREAS
jgi:hypothetical protein